MTSLEWPIQGSLGVLGKLPGMGDFINISPPNLDTRPLQRWLSDGISQLRHTLGSGWEHDYDTNLHHRFVYRDERSPNTFAGILRASMDATERRHPVALFCVLPSSALDSYPNLIPLQADLLYGYLDELLEELVPFSNSKDLKLALDAPLSIPTPQPEPELRYYTFLDDVTCGQIVGPKGSDGVELLTHLISELSALQQRHQSTKQVITMPLNLPPFGWPLEVRFWLELSLILLRWYPPALSYAFGAPNPRANSPGYLHLGFKPLPSALFPGLVHPNGIGPSLWGPWLKRPMNGAVGSRRIRLNLAPQHTLRELLNFLQPGYPLSCPWNRYPLVEK